MISQFGVLNGSLKPLFSVGSSVYGTYLSWLSVYVDMARRTGRCNHCREDPRALRPIYARTYGEMDKSGKFVTAFWLCGRCLEELKQDHELHGGPK